MSHIWWWLFGALGFGGIVMVLLGITVGWPILIAFFQTRVGRWIALAGAAAVGIVVALGKARDAGAADEKARQEKENADYLARQAETDKRIAGESDAALDDSLRSHDGKPRVG